MIKFVAAFVFLAGCSTAPLPSTPAPGEFGGECQTGSECADVDLPEGRAYGQCLVVGGGVPGPNGKCGGVIRVGGAYFWVLRGADGTPSWCAVDNESCDVTNI
jgi:hypothetical protein